MSTPRWLAMGSLFLCVAGCSSSKTDPVNGVPAATPDCTTRAQCLAAQRVPCTTAATRTQCLAAQLTCESKDGTETCVPCAEGQYASDPDTCTKIPGDELAHDFGTYHLGGSQEMNSLCQSWTLHNDEELWVNGVELTTNGGYHHSNWLFVPDDKYDGPDGAWPCDDRGYDELTAAVAGGVLFAQSTQAKHQVQKFQDGVAVRLPPHARIIGGTHLLNTTPDAIDSALSLAIYSLPAADVKVPLAPFRLSYLDLTIPPHAVSEFSGACDFSAAVPTGTPGDLDMDLYYLMPHYHALGHSFHLETMGGPNDGKAIYDVGAFDGEAHGTPLDPPVSMRGASGFRFSCGFDNPRNDEVGWGIGNQEMCVMLGFARSDYAFDASVLKGASTTPKADGTKEYEGDCTVLPLEFARGKGSLNGTDAGTPDGGAR